MSKPPSINVPSCRRHRPSGQAVVTLDDKDHYLGPFRSTASHEAYNRLVCERLVSGRHLRTPQAAGWHPCHPPVGGRFTGQQDIA
jgi:hypothetical protein